MTIHVKMSYFSNPRDDYLCIKKSGNSRSDILLFPGCIKWVYRGIQAISSD